MADQIVTVLHQSFDDRGAVDLVHFVIHMRRSHGSIGAKTIGVAFAVIRHDQDGIAAIGANAVNLPPVAYLTGQNSKLWVRLKRPRPDRTRIHVSVMFAAANQVFAIADATAYTTCWLSTSP